MYPCLSIIMPCTVEKKSVYLYFVLLILTLPPFLLLFITHYIYYTPQCIHFLVTIPPLWTLNSLFLPVHLYIVHKVPYLDPSKGEKYTNCNWAQNISRRKKYRNSKLKCLKVFSMGIEGEKSFTFSHLYNILILDLYNIIVCEGK